MKFHLRTLELFGETDLVLDPERAAAAVRSASAVGVTLPDAVAEWYSVPEWSDLWSWYSGCHSWAVWLQPGSNGIVRPFPESEEDYRVWVNPEVRHDSSGWVKGPILPLMDENQGCWEWGVVLDGTPDPPAVISFDGCDTWDTCADSFSTYVYSIIFDVSLFRPGGIRQSFRMEQCVSGDGRRALREEFQAEPTTRGAGCVSGVFTERFSRSGQRLSFWNLYEQRFSCWEIWAADEAGFADLTGRLCRVFPTMNALLRANDLTHDDAEIPF